MLTLGRRVGEAIRIGEDVTIVVRAISGRQVAIGIIAPVVRTSGGLSCSNLSRKTATLAKGGNADEG